MNTLTTTRTVARSGWRFVILAGAMLVVTALPREVSAQSENATLRGKAAASSEITARNIDTGLERRVRAGSDGTYVLVGLPPGTYQVDAGPGTQRNVTLGVASTATLDFAGAAQGAAPPEEIVVQATRLNEVKTSEIGGGISLRQIEVTPQITRNFLEFADAVPGMQFSVDAQGRTQIRSGTLNTGTTNVYIDGVGQKNYVRPSGVTGQGGVSTCPRCGENQNTVGDPGNPFPQLAIAEYKVITSNYKAEYDQVSGAAITAVTKSGTNEFEAGAFYTYTDADFRAETPAEEAAGTGKEGGDSKEYGFSLGGPIIKDKMHFFFTYEGKEFTTPNTVVAPPLFDDNNTALDWVGGLTPELRENYGPVANPFDEDLYFGKLDWEFSDVDRIELSGKFRKERQQAGAAGVIAESAAFTYINDDDRLQLSWEHAGDRFFNEATVTYEDVHDSPSKTSSEPGRQFVALGTAGAGFDPILLVDGVDPLGYFFTTQEGYSVQDNLTFSNLSWYGDHTIKTGVKFKDVELQFRDAETAALYSFYVSPTPADNGIEEDPFQVTFGAQADSDLSTTTTSKNRQYGIYIQDDWAVNDRLTLNIGVRYDYEETPSYTDYVTPQRFVDALNGLDTNACPPNLQNDPSCPYFFNGGYHGAQPGQTYAETLAIAGININDYISNGHNRSNPSDQIAPRFGFSYDLNADQEHVIFGGAGRSYDRNTFSILQHEANKAALYVPTVQFWNANNPACPPDTLNNPSCIPWDDAYLTPEGLQSIAPSPFGEMHLINNNLDAPYSDQFSLGMRNRLGVWDTSVAFAYITSYDGVIASLGNYFGDGTWWWYDTGQWSGYTALVPSPVGGQALYLFDNAKATRTKQVLLSVDKPYTVDSGWSASFAYTYSDAKERLEFNGDYQFDYAYPYYSPYVTSSRVPKHRLVAVGSYDAPWGINLGAKVVLETPKPFTGFDRDNTEPPNGLNNQWLKISQFPEDTLGYFTLDLQVTKSFEFGNGSVFQIRADVLNVTNHRNYADLIDGYPGLPFYNTDGNIAGVPRTLKLGANFRF
jgi:outer membrane receptor protein involved in Fe transport